MGIIARQSIKNSVFTYLGFALGALNTMILMPAAMAKEQVGLLQAMTSYTNIVIAFLTLGMPMVIVRFFGEYRDKGKAGNLLSFAVMVPFSVFSLGVFFYLFFKDEILNLITKEHEPLLYSYFSLTLIMVFSNLLFELLAAFLRAHLVSVYQVFLKEFFLRFLNTVSFSLFFFGIYPYKTLVYIYVACFALISILLLLSSINYIRLYGIGLAGLPGKKKLADYGFFTVLNKGITFLVFQLDLVMIQYFNGLAELAVYSLALAIAIFVQLPERAQMPIVHGVITKAFHENNMAEVAKVYKKSSLTLFIIGGVVVGLLCICLPAFNTIILPDSYLIGLTPVFILLALAKWVDISFGLNGYIILQSKYYRFEMWSGLALLALAFFLNWIFIKNYGMVGAATASLISLSAYNIFRFLFIFFKLKMSPFTFDTVKALGILAVAFFVSYLLPFEWNNLAYAIVRGTLFLFLCLLGIWWLKPSEDIHAIAGKLLAQISTRMLRK